MLRVGAPVFRLEPFETLGQGTEFSHLPPTKVSVGEKFVLFPVTSEGLRPGNCAKLSVDVPRFSSFHFPEVLLSGFRQYSIGDRFFTEKSLVNAPLANLQWAKRFNRGYNECLRIDPETGLPRRGAIETIDCTKTAILAIDMPSNFGHWLTYLLPKLVLVDRYQRICRLMLPMRLGWERKIAEFFAPHKELIEQDVRRHYRLLNPIIPSLAIDQYVYRPEVNEALDPFIKRAVRASSNLPERVYISRRKQAIVQPRHRIMENEGELVERLVEKNFVEIIPEDMPIERQVAIFANARSIVTVGGSNMFGCYFARRAEIIVDIEATDHFVRPHSHVLASSGLPYSVVVGRQTGRGKRLKPHANFTIDVDALLKGLAALGVA